MSIAGHVAQLKTDFDSVYEGGKQYEYDRFWDSYQINGTRTGYQGAFAGVGWDVGLLKPKYSIAARSTYMMFAFCGYTGDLDDIFKNRGLTLTVNPDSGAQGYMFYNTCISAIGDIDLSSFTDANQLSSMFNSPNLITIRNLIPPKAPMNASVWGTNLTNLGIDGEISYNWQFTRSTILTHDSLMNVINALADYSQDTSGTAHTLTLGATNLAKLTNAEKAIATQKGWTLA